MHVARLFCEEVLLPDGWRRDVLITVGADGRIEAVEPEAAPERAERLPGPVVPGMPNLHSHAFQRAMAGLVERAGPAADSFWTWRETMYGFLGRLGPDEIEAIAAQTYLEMLKAGYTAVAEFHYVHHAPDGSRYRDPAELSLRVLSAARRVGIALTHLPVLYAHADFGGRDPLPEQRRFLTSVDELLRIRDGVVQAARGDPDVVVGLAPHSLRAVSPRLLAEALAGLDARDPAAPVHIHVAEQVREVEACLAWSGRRPVEWLLDEAPVSSRWCLVHATHLAGSEIDRLAASGAVVGLCPTTEANLGDGIFPAEAFLARGGRFGIGSDSNVSISPMEELRWLEYGQRLVHRRRAVLAGGGPSSVGARLYRDALAGGATALGRQAGRIAPGFRADLVMLDRNHPSLLGKRGDVLLDAAVFAAGVPPVRHVMVGGRWVVRDGRHRDEERIGAGYARALETVAA